MVSFSLFLVSILAILAILWGAVWAIVLQFVPIGQFLASKRKWVTVVVGVGVDLLLALPITPFQYWWPIALIIVLSSLGIIYRSLHNEQTGESPEKIRLKNKVQWALEDITALAMCGQDEIDDLAEQPGDAANMALAIMKIRTRFTDIEWLAKNAHRGEYESKQVKD